MNTAQETTPVATAAEKEPAKATKAVAAPAKKAPASPTKAKTEKAKVAAAPKAKAAPSKAIPIKEAKTKKPKLVRDSFTIPKDEYLVIENLKQRALGLSHPVKKSELLRAGLKLLAGLSDAALRTALQAVPSIKTGRPTKEAQAPQPKPVAVAAPKAKPAAKARTK
ncbi:MAG: hypothetical protein O9331_18855 [Acidovorax sp.]|uniref:hypothetical protein n=1 Tax=Acidovorax sp. 106 TaxID=2135637 RepID=UPI000EB336A6|nr:hypothetical protein [Acidovorax sp. 106]MCZ8095539.1 hypothetical protein [Acidovorax sp.]RLJ36610.1 hypothetical protein C8C98_0292 [Acidovorax sp. 106]